MTITDTPPDTPADAGDDTAAAASADVGFVEPTGLAGLFASGEHKTIGRLYLGVGGVFALFSLVIAVLVGFEQVDMAGVDIFGGSEAYFQMAVLYRASLVFCVVVPLFLGLAIHMVPLQIGAPSVAFPRLAAASFWAWFIGAGVFVASILADGGPNAGGDADAIELTHISLALTVLALLAGTVSVLTTIIAQRPVGMTLFELPLYSWSMLVAGGIWLLTLPVLLADLMLGWVDLRGDGALFFETPVFGNYRYLAWVFEQPQVFAFAIPVLGILAELIPVLFGIRQRLHGVMMGAIGGFGLLSIGAYAQPAFNADVSTEVTYVVQSLLLLIPMLILLGGWADTALRGRREGRVKPTPQLVLGVVALLMLLAGGAVAGLRVLGAAIGGLREFGTNDSSWQDGLDDFLEPLDLAGTSALSGMFNYVLVAGLVAAVAGVHYWAPKVIGRPLNSPIGYLSGAALLGGTVLFSLPEVLNAFLDEPDLPYVGPVDDGVEALNTVGAIGAVMLVGGILLVALNVVVTTQRRGGEPVGPNPWGGSTLEWATASPPPRGNFDTVPVVRSAAPLLDPAPADDSEEDEA